MTDEEMKRSYEHYRQWQVNKVRYRNESIAYALMLGAGVLVVIKNWQRNLFQECIMIRE